MERWEVDRLKILDDLIKTAIRVKEKAQAKGADWLVEAAEKELIFARYQKEKYLKSMMKK